MMACDAAIAAVRRMLPAGSPRGRGQPPAPITARQAFETMNWWTFATVEEAFTGLVRTGEAETMQIPGSDEVGYHQAAGRARDRR